MQAQTKVIDMTRVTLVVPNQVWENVKRLVPAGRRSQLVTEALEAEVSTGDERFYNAAAGGFSRIRWLGNV